MMAAKTKRRFKAIYLLPLGVLVVAAVAVVLIAQPFGASTTDAQYLTGVVTRGTIEQTISSSGVLAAGATRQVNALVSGEVSKVHVKVGEQVEKGDVLFSLTNTDVDEEIATARAQLTAAQQQLKAARASLTAANATQVQTEKEILAGLVSGTSSDNGSSGSSGTGESTRTQATGGATVNTTAASAPTAAQKKTAKVQAAQSKANKVRAIAQAQAEVTSANQSVKTAQTAYDDARNAKGDTEVTAPIDGVVSAVAVAKGDEVSGSSSSSSSQTSAAQGADASSITGSTGSGSTATAAIELSSFSDRMTLTVDASESEVDSLKAGMKAVLAFDAFADLEQEGSITDISPLGTTSGGLVTYPVTIELNNPDARLKPGMNTAATIVLASVSDVLMVPNTAIEGNAEGGYSVKVAADGDTTQLETRSVTLGLANDTYTEVSSGLSEGEVVVTGTVDTSTTSSSSSGGIMGGGMPGVRTEIKGVGPSGGVPGGSTGSSTRGTSGSSSGGGMAPQQ